MSESLIAEALHPYPEDLVIATKGGLERTASGQWPANGRPEHLRAALDGSLRRLAPGQIPLYQFHRPDPKVPLEDSIGTLAELKAQGQDPPPRRLQRQRAAAAHRPAITPIVSVQNRYNVADRSSESMVDLCEQEQLTFLPWAPIIDLDAQRQRSRRSRERHDVTPRQIALAWLLARSPAMLPIPGTGSVSHLEHNVDAAHIELNAAEVAEVRAAA